MTKTDFLSMPAGRALEAYQALHRHQNRPHFEVGPVVHLFPDVDCDLATEGTSPWTAPWPFGNRAGVYFVFSINRELLYVGKASMGQCLGKRLYCHFGGDDQRCIFNELGWRIAPHFVAVVATPEDSPFEAPALEEYMISQLLPKLNTCGL